MKHKLKRTPCLQQAWWCFGDASVGPGNLQHEEGKINSIKYEEHHHVWVWPDLPGGHSSQVWSDVISLLAAGHCAGGANFVIAGRYHAPVLYPGVQQPLLTCSSVVVVVVVAVAWHDSLALWSPFWRTIISTHVSAQPFPSFLLAY